MNPHRDKLKKKFLKMTKDGNEKISRTRNPKSKNRNKNFIYPQNRAKWPRQSGFWDTKKFVKAQEIMQKDCKLYIANQWNINFLEVVWE